MDDKPQGLAFFRITVLGGSNSGKTSLVNSWVNGICPDRYAKTDNAVVYYKKTELEEGEIEEESSKVPCLVEVEDTPGSERGPEGADDAVPAREESGPNAGAPKIKKGSRVIVLTDEREVKACFDALPDKKVAYKSVMRSMLGREYTVKMMARDGTVGLPSPDGSEGGIWNFPLAALKLKVSLELPIDQYLDVTQRKMKELSSRPERKVRAKKMQHPFSAYERPIGPPDMDKTLTKNRMGYMICFDLSDETYWSLKEAMTVYQLLKSAVKNKKNNTLLPIIWLVGTKSDKTSLYDAIEANRSSAMAWSDEVEIPFRTTSARLHRGVHTLFEELIQAISSREILWGLAGEPDDDDDAAATGEDANCTLS